MIESASPTQRVEITQESTLNVHCDPRDSESAAVAASPPRHVASVKSALKTGSSARGSFRVQWAPDVYEPCSSMVSHTKGNKGVKPTLVSRRAKSRSQNSKGHHGKHKKGKSSDKTKDKGLPAKGLSEQGSQPSEACAADEKVDFEHEDTGETAPSSPNVEVSEKTERKASPGATAAKTSVDCVGSEVPSVDLAADVVIMEGQKDGADPTVSPCADAITGTGLADVPPAELSESVKNVYTTGKSEKKRPKRGSSKFAASKGQVTPSVQVADQDPKVSLEQVSVKRLAGATALTAGDMELAQELLLSALVEGRLLKAHAEQARCLRLLADSQSEEQREKSLVSAVECFASTTLAFEHAEALLCLAQHQVHDVLGKMSLQWNSWKWLQMPSLVSTNSDMNDSLQGAKTHLQTAAGLLLKNHLAPPSLASPLCTSLGLESPTGRRRKSKSKQTLPAEFAAATVVMGNICEVWGKVSILLGEFDEAHAQLFAASRNSLWCQDCPDEALHVQELLESLFGDKQVASKPPLVCAVY